MSFSYTCPNPECGVTLKTPNRPPAGKSVKCPKCSRFFVPEPEGSAGKEEATKGTPRPAAPPPEPAKSEPAAPPGKLPFLDDDEDSPESVKKGYGIIEETEEEKREAEKHKPKFTEVQDKFKKSARGPAQALLVMPSNLLVFEGLITIVAGIVAFVIGMWPLVFNDAPPGEEELEEAIFTMLIGMFVFVWGAFICFGASQMQELGSYTWAMAGSIVGVLPILVGIFGILMLQNPKVKAGFEEVEGLVDEDGEDKDKDDEEDEEEEEEEEDDDEEEGRSSGSTASKTAKKLAKRGARKLLSNLTGSGDEESESDEDTEEQTDEEKPRKKKRGKRRSDDEDDE